MLNDILKEFHVSMRLIIDLATKSNSRNELGRHYGKHSFNNVLQHYKERDNGWTENAQKTINDHLDILADYLIDPNLGAKVPEQVVLETEAPVLSLKERLEKERAEGKWPSVDEKIAFNKLKAEPIAKVDEVVGVPGGFEIKGQLLKPIDEVIPGYSGLGKPDRVKVKLRKIHKHNKRKITINIYI